MAFFVFGMNKKDNSEVRCLTWKLQHPSVSWSGHEQSIHNKPVPSWVIQWDWHFKRWLFSSNQSSGTRMTYSQVIIWIGLSLKGNLTACKNANNNQTFWIRTYEGHAQKICEGEKKKNQIIASLQLWGFVVIQSLPASILPHPSLSPSFPLH